MRERVPIVGLASSAHEYLDVARTQRRQADSYRAIIDAGEEAGSGPDGNDDAIAAGGKANALSESLSQLLGSRLGFGIAENQPVAQLFGRRYLETELSAGQHLLLTWALLVLERENEVGRGSVLFVDEPERQLHPDAAVAIVERLLTTVGDDGQLWIATHSPSIVARFGHQSTYNVVGHTARYSGSRIDAVMDGLLGGRENRREFATFLEEADRLNLMRYTVEALFPPGVVGHQEGDPQEAQFISVVRRCMPPAESQLRLLDYGAGRARFAVALADSLSADLLRRVDYYAYNDPHHNDHGNECAANIARLHPADANGRVSTVVSDFYGENRVNVAVMSNLLHEIEPTDWYLHFRNVASILQDDGVLVLMEDQEPPIGELPTRNGLVILDLDALRLLFGGLLASDEMR